MSELRVMLLQLQMPNVNTASEKLSSIERICAIIKASPGADLYVLPELAVVGYTENAFAALEVLAEDEFSNDSMCRVKFASLARELQAFICYGVPGKLSQKNNYAIRQIVLDENGEVVMSYDKCHPCDYGDCAETRFFSPGSTLGYFDCKGFRIGCLICSDMRYTELARTLAVDHECDIILHPVAFKRDCSFPSFRPFVIARALENQVYWASVNYAGEDFGGSMWCPPWVDDDSMILEQFGLKEEVRIFTAKKDVITQARADFPFRRLRKDVKQYRIPQLSMMKSKL